MRYSLLIFALCLLLPACTEVTENYAGECVPDELKCLGKDVAACLADGTTFSVVKSCDADTPCTENEEGQPDCEAGGTVVGCGSDADCTTQLTDVGACREAFCDAGKCRIRVQDEGSACDDGNQCTENETCIAGLCFGEALTCDDGDLCTKDSCNPLSGCTYEDNEGAACDDGAPCTKKDTCTEGACAGTLVNCDDGNQCTSDECDQATGECVFIANSDLCDDGNLCTDGDKCLAGICVGQPNAPCTKNDDCLSCGNPCLGQFICKDLVCQPDPETVIKCPQELGPCQVNQCFVESDQAVCKPVSKPNETTCEDGDDCTYDDLCKNGNCFGLIDLEKEGCSVFELRSWTFTSGGGECKNASYTLRAGIAVPRVYGEAKNDKYTLKTVAP